MKPNADQAPRARFQRALLLSLALPLLASAEPAGGTPLSGGAPSSTIVAAAEGRIEGRVFNERSGTFVENARITVAGTDRVVFSDAAGEFRIEGLPAGQAVLQARFAGLPIVTERVVVRPGEATECRLVFGAVEETIKLDAFVVAESRELNAASIAIQEQRYAPNLKNVVAADAFGDSTENNVAEFVKFIPGVAIDYSGPDARNVSVRGMPASNTPILVDGFQVASASSSSVTRLVEVQSLSMNNVARVEVSKVPTPDVPANSLGGSVNTVSKSAFERSKPLFAYRLFLGARGDDLSFSKQPGPLPQIAGRRITPNADFSYVLPLSRTLGFTFGASLTNRYTQTHFTNTIWVPYGSPSNLATADNPMLRMYQLLDQPAMTTRKSGSASLDWKLAPKHILSVAAQYFHGTMDQTIETLSWDVAGSSTSPRPAAWGQSFTEGAATRGNVTYTTENRRKDDITRNFNVRYRHDGAVWKIQAGASYSNSVNFYTAPENGYFDNATIRLSNVTIGFDRIGDVRPGLITVRDAAGAPIESREPGSFRLISTTNGTVRNSEDEIKGFKAAVSRGFDWSVPVTIKVGGDYNSQEREIDQTSPFWNFVGPDRTANTADDQVSRYDLLDDSGYSRQRPPFGEPFIQWPDGRKIYALYQQHPEYFATDATRDIISTASNSRWIKESITAGFVRGDVHLWQRRVWLVGGVRYERTDDEGAGAKNDVRATYRQDSEGRLILDAAGKPVRITTDPVDLARLQYTKRGARNSRSYDDFYPSLNATWTITPDLLARLGYAQTIGRPDFNNIVPGISISDPGATIPTITVNNTGLLPWSSENYDLSLEYYFKSNGLVSAGVFRKDLKDFFGLINTPATSDLLQEFGLADEYLGYTIATRKNVGDARVTGVEFNFRKGLTFLPHWARGVQVFANATDLRLEGASTADFTTFVKRNINWGVSLSRPRYSVNLNWNYRGRERRALVTGTNIPADTYEYLAPRLLLDLNLEVRLRPNLALYFTSRNLTNEPSIRERYAPGSPGYGRRYQTGESGTFYSLGFKGEF